MNLSRALTLAVLCLSAPALAGEPKTSAPTESKEASSSEDRKTAFPSLVPAAPGECKALPSPRAGPVPFPTGESLSYDVDVMGVNAGKMSFEVLPRVGRGAKAQIPVQVRAKSNTFFNKVRRIKADLKSNLAVRTLRPVTFREDLHEGNFSRLGQVSFPTNEEKWISLEWRSNRGGGKSRHGFANDALDYVGAIFLFRALPLAVGQEFCFDVYAMRRIWRVVGKVEAREHVSIPAGEFEAYHLSAMATRVGPGKKLEREVHVWISDDEYRLPLAAIGVIDLGPVRATLGNVNRVDFQAGPPAGKPLEW